MTTSLAEPLPTGADRAAARPLPCLLRSLPWRREAQPDNGPRCRLAALLQALLIPSPGPTGERPTPHVLPNRGAEHGSWLVYAQAPWGSSTSHGAVQRNPRTPRTAGARSLVAH